MNVDTRARRRMLATIAGLTRQYGVPPTVRELSDALGYKSTDPTHHHLVILRDAGLVTWQEGKNRTLRIVEREPA